MTTKEKIKLTSSHPKLGKALALAILRANKKGEDPVFKVITGETIRPRQVYSVK